MSWLSNLFGGSQAPYTTQQTAIGNQQAANAAVQNAQGGANVTAGSTGLQGAAGTAAGTAQDLTSLGVGGTLTMEQLLAALGGGLQTQGGALIGGGAGQAATSGELLTSLGIPAGVGGLQGAGNASDILTALGLGNAAQGGAAGAGALPLFMQGVTTEATGQLPAGGQAAVAQNLQQTEEAIKGQFAALGMSGSTAEAAALDNAKQQSLINQFSIAGQLGSQETQQALGLGQFANTLASLGIGGVQAGGGIAGNLASLGFGGLGTAGGIGTSLASIGGGLSSTAAGAYGASGNLSSQLDQLGFNYANLSSSDWANIVQSGLSEMGIGGASLSGASSTYNNLAQLQFQEDTQLNQIIGKFFQGLGSGISGGSIGSVAGGIANSTGTQVPGTAPSFFGKGSFP